MMVTFELDIEEIAKASVVPRIPAPMITM